MDLREKERLLRVEQSMVQREEEHKLQLLKKVPVHSEHSEGGLRRTESWWNCALWNVLSLGPRIPTALTTCSGFSESCVNVVPGPVGQVAERARHLCY